MLAMKVKKITHLLYNNDIGRIENMDYDSENDLFICQNGKT